MDPINYTMNVLDPLQGYMQGIQFGEGLKTTRLGQQQAQQNMDIQSQNFADQQRALQEQRAAAAQQQQQAKAMQEQLMGLRQSAIDGTLTPDALNKFALDNAKTFDEFKTAFNAVSEPRRQADTQFGIQLSTSLLRGNTEAALSMLDTRISAAENSGTDQGMQEVQKLKAIRSQVEIDPIGFATANLANLAAQGAVSSEVMKSVLDASGQNQFRPATAAEAAQYGATSGQIDTKTGEFKATGDKGPLVQNVMGDQETEFAKTAGKSSAEMFSNMTEQGFSAGRNLTELENLDSVLSGTQTGAGASIKSFLGQYGVDTAGLSEIQAAEAAINRLVPAQRPPGSGTMSDADLALFKRSLPALINQPGGNKLIIETIRAINQYDVAASIIAGDALDGTITPKEARQALRDLPNPLADFKAPKAAPASVKKPVVIDGVTIQRIE